MKVEVARFHKKVFEIDDGFCSQIGRNELTPTRFIIVHMISSICGFECSPPGPPLNGKRGSLAELLRPLATSGSMWYGKSIFFRGVWIFHDFCCAGVALGGMASSSFNPIIVHTWLRMRACQINLLYMLEEPEFIFKEIIPPTRKVLPRALLTLGFCFAVEDVLDTRCMTSFVRSQTVWRRS